MDYEDTNFPSDTDLDFSFTSTTTDRTFASSSARSSLARSSLNLSFNERLSTTTTTTTITTSPSSLHHRKNDPHWSSIKTATNLSSDGKLHLHHLKLLRHLGTGNLGRVFLCQLKDCSKNTTFALKVVDRDSLSKKKISHVETEAEILYMLDHPFFPTLYARLDVSHYTCLLIDYCPNGDLHSLLRKQHGNRLPVQAVRFFAAEILVALEYLHAIGVVYRDLKPENIMLREDGHIMLSDFDLCFKADVVPSLNKTVNSVRRRRTRGGRYRCSCFGRRGYGTDEEDVVTEFVAEPTAAFSSSCVGTHEYLAPELLSGNGHGNGVDWWAFGVLIYELLYGKTPFKGGSKEITLRNIASSRQVVFPESAAVETAEMEAAKDLISMLLIKDPRTRLGSLKGATEIKRHRFFEGIKWPLIRHYKPPEVRGLRKVRSNVNHMTAAVIAASPRRRCSWRWLKRGLIGRGSSRVNQILSSSRNNCNNNQHSYKVRKMFKLLKFL